MSQTTRRAPGRPKKAQTEANAIPATPPPVKKKVSLKRKEQDPHVARVYEIPKKAGIVYMIPQKGVTVYDAENDTVREMRYCPNEPSIWVDEQSENAKREAIVFRNGKLIVPREKPNLRKFLDVHPQNIANGGQLFKQMDEAKDAEIKLNEEMNQFEAVSMIKNSDLEDLLAVALFFKVNIDRKTSEIKYDLLQIAKKTPSKFIQAFDDPAVKMKALVRQAKEYQVISIKKDSVRWFDSNSLIVSVPHGQEPEDIMVRFLLTEKGASVVSEIEKQLDL
ncbi:MAG: hypothetical protein NWE77_06605 [Candidatus Bathyarchaeota archaeon]|nr:hypothetical protein [Candidatus Bathyarchaeota archaeon]